MARVTVWSKLVLEFGSVLGSCSGSGLALGFGLVLGCYGYCKEFI